MKPTARPPGAGGAPRAGQDLSAQLEAFSPYGRGRGRPPQPQPRPRPQLSAGGWGQNGGGTLAERFKNSDAPSDFGKRAPPPYRRKTRRQWWSPMRHKGHMRQVWSFPRRMAAQKPLTPSWKGVLVFKQPPAA